MYLVYFRYLGGLSRPAPRIGSIDGEGFFSVGRVCHVFIL